MSDIMTMMIICVSVCVCVHARPYVCPQPTGPDSHRPIPPFHFPAFPLGKFLKPFLSTRNRRHEPYYVR